MTLVYEDSYDGILAKVLRGKQEFDAPLDWIEATDQGSTNYDLLGDYAVWFVNYGD